MRGEADDGAGAQLQSRVGRREIVLPDVHPGRTALAREIDSIVDDDLRAVGFSRADDAVAEIEEKPPGEVLVITPWMAVAEPAVLSLEPDTAVPRLLVPLTPVAVAPNARPSTPEPEPLTALLL